MLQDNTNTKFKINVMLKKAIFMFAVLLVGTASAQNNSEWVGDQKTYGFEVGFTPEVIFTNAMLKESSYTLGQNDSHLSGYFTAAMDFLHTNEKWYAGIETRIYTALQTNYYGEDKFYRSSGGVKVGYKTGKVVFVGGFQYPVMNSSDYFKGIYSGGIDFKAHKHVMLSLVGNYYTNAQLFHYTYGAGLGLKITL